MKKNFGILLAFAMILSLLVLPANVHAEEDNVAKIGDKEYSTLQEAIDAAGENKTTIVLVGEVLECVSIKENQNITIDLNNHKITNGPSDRIDTITNAGILTIKGEGQVDNTVAWIAIKAAAVRNEDGGTCTLSSGKYTRSKENSDTNSYYVLLNRGNMTIKDSVIVRNEDGDYSSLIENGYFSANDNINKTYAKLVIEGGNFIGGRYNVKNDDYGILEINGGNFEIGRNWNILNWNEVTINNGNFINTAGKNIFAGMDKSYEYEDGKLIITGGKFKSTHSSTWCLDVGTDLDLIEITGGTYDNAMKDDDWRVSDDLVNSDPTCIPDTHTKVAVGTDNEAQYVFKIVPLKDGVNKSLTVSKNETKTLATLDGINVSNLRVYEIAKKEDTEKDDYVWANDVATRTAKVKYDDKKLVESDIADIQFNTTNGLEYTGKSYGTVEFVISYTTLDNPTEYKTGTITIQVKPKVTAIPVMDETKLNDSYSQNVNDDNKVVESNFKEGVDALLEKSSYVDQLDNYVFDGWYTDESLKTKVDFNQAINTDVTIYAHYVRPNVKVTFIGKDGVIIDEKNIKKGEDASFVEAPVIEGYTFIEWDKTENDLKNIKEDIVVNAKYEMKKVTVTFVDKYEKVIEKQTIDYGQDGKAPEIPNIEGYTFVGWDRDYTNVREDIIVKAEYEPVKVTLTLQAVVNCNLYGNSKTIDVNYGTILDKETLRKEIVIKYPELKNYDFVDVYIDKELSKQYEEKPLKTDSVVYLEFTYVEPEQPSEPTKPVESEQPSEPTKPVEPEQPSEPTKPVEPEQPSETAETVEPEQLFKPTDSTTSSVKSDDKTTSHNDNKENVKTSDDNNMTLYASIMATALVGMTIILLDKKKRDLLNK